MAKLIVGGTKDPNGIYTPVPPTKPAEIDPIQHDISIDDLMTRAIQDIYGILRAIRLDIGTGAPSRETVQNLKDCLTMLSDLKKREKELLDSMSDEELKKFLNK